MHLSPLLEPLGEDAAQRDRDGQTRMAIVHGSLGTVVRGDDTRNAIERLIHRFTGRPAATVRVDWDGTENEPVGRRQRPYLTQVVYRSQHRHADLTQPPRSRHPSRRPRWAEPRQGGPAGAATVNPRAGDKPLQKKK